MKNNFHNFSARTKSKVSLYTLRKETLKQLLNQREDLYIEVEKAREYYKDTSMPYVDFCLPKYTLCEGKKPSDILRHAVLRLLRINKNLTRIANAFEIVRLLKAVS